MRHFQPRRVQPRRAAGHDALGRRLLAAARSAWTRYWTRRAARATVGILQRLDDRALKDIGLDRSEIERVAYGDCRRSGPCHAAM